MGTNEFYDTIYKSDSSARSKTSFLYRKLRRYELNRYELTCRMAPGGDSLLDIGCGDGELLLLLRNKYRELWGIDISKPRIDRILQRIETENYSNVHMKLGDVDQRISFEDESFDTVTAVAVLEHIFNPYHVMRECRRLLRQDGTLIVMVPNVAYLPNRIKLLFGKLPVTSNGIDGWDGGHLHYFTGASLQELFEDEGFRVVKCTCGGIFAGPRSFWGYLLGGDILVKGIKK